MGRPTNANQQAIRPTHSNLVEAPLAVSQDPPRADDQIVHPSRDGIHLRRTDKDSERVVLLWHPPGTAPSLREVHFAIPAGHDDVVGVPTCTLETQALPERLSG